MNLVIARAVQTSMAFPVQWNAWTADGKYLYLRYRSGRGTVHHFSSPDIGTWDMATWQSPLAVFEQDDLYGFIDLETFCELAGITFTPGFQRVDFDEYISSMIKMAGLGDAE